MFFLIFLQKEKENNYLWAELTFMKNRPNLSAPN